MGQGRLRQPDPLLQGPRRRGRAVAPPASSHAKVFACPSTGNLANAVAAAAARAGIKTVVFIPHDLEQPKSSPPPSTPSTLVAVDGNYDDVNRLASEIAGEEEGWAFVNVNVRPYYAEGSKTLGYEVAEQLGWRLPEQIVIPVASGSQLTKVDKGFQELSSSAWSRTRRTRSSAPRRTGCSPVSAAFKDGHDVVRPVKPDTIAKSLAIGNPADGPYVLDVARRTGGAIEDVTDDEVREGIQLLARTEGIFAETAGGVTVATLKKLVETGQLDPERRDRRLQHRRRAQDARRGRRPGRPGRDDRRRRTRVHRHRPGCLTDLSRRHRRDTSDRQGDTTHERQRPHPDDPAHLHRRRVRGPAPRARRWPRCSTTSTSSYPGIKARILDDQGAIRRFVNVYVGNDDVRFLEALDTTTPEGAQVSVIPAVAGGC